MPAAIFFRWKTHTPNWCKTNKQFWVLWMRVHERIGESSRCSRSVHSHHSQITHLFSVDLYILGCDRIDWLPPMVLGRARVTCPVRLLCSCCGRTFIRFPIRDISTARNSIVDAPDELNVLQNELRRKTKTIELHVPPFNEQNSGANELNLIISLFLCCVRFECVNQFSENNWN